MLGFQVGVTIAAHKYDLNSTTPFQTSDILDLRPVVKHSIPVSAEVKGLVETGKLHLDEVITMFYLFIFEYGMKYLCMACY